MILQIDGGLLGDYLIKNKWKALMDIMDYKKIKK